MLKTKILVVDDEPSVQGFCVALLRIGGFDSIVAGNGLDAIEIYRERHEEICLVLSDVSMPVMGGLELRRRLLEYHSHVNVILMSGADLHKLSPNDVRMPGAVLQKPFAPGRLLQAVKLCLMYEDDHDSTGHYPPGVERRPLGFKLQLG